MTHFCAVFLSAKFVLPCINISMKNQITLVVLFAILSVAIAQKDLTVSCTSCGASTCASGFCFNIKGSSFNETICVPQGKTCKAGLSQSLSVNNCTTDYASTNCAPGICMYAVNVPIVFLGSTCANTYTETITCGSCNSAAGCGAKFCQGVTKSPSTTAAIGCVESCPTPTSSTRTVQACSGGFDGVGGQNDCCMTFQTNSAPVCITQNSFLASSTLVMNYVKGTNFELHFGSILVTLLALCLAFML